MFLNLKSITLFLLIGIVCPAFVYADEFEDAVKAVNRRDYETAYKMIVPPCRKRTSCGPIGFRDDVL